MSQSQHSGTDLGLQKPEHNKPSNEITTVLSHSRMTFLEAAQEHCKGQRRQE